jgi:hypothetical protein
LPRSPASPISEPTGEKSDERPAGSHRQGGAGHARRPWHRRRLRPATRRAAIDGGSASEGIFIGGNDRAISVAGDPSPLGGGTLETFGTGPRLNEREQVTYRGFVSEDFILSEAVLVASGAARHVAAIEGGAAPGGDAFSIFGATGRSTR